MAAMLDVKNINVYYGAIHAVKDISFHVDEGEIVTLIGANGAGKTTTLQTVSACSTPAPAPSSFWGSPSSPSPPPSWWAGAWPRCRRDAGCSSI